jgi:hypothetical protein
VCAGNNLEVLFYHLGSEYEPRCVRIEAVKWFGGGFFFFFFEIKIYGLFAKLLWNTWRRCLKAKCRHLTCNPCSTGFWIVMFGCNSSLLGAHFPGLEDGVEYIPQQMWRS